MWAMAYGGDLGAVLLAGDNRLAGPADILPCARCEISASLKGLLSIGGDGHLCRLAPVFRRPKPLPMRPAA